MLATVRTPMHGRARRTVPGRRSVEAAPHRLHESECPTLHVPSFINYDKFKAISLFQKMKQLHLPYMSRVA